MRQRAIWALLAVVVVVVGATAYLISPRPGTSVADPPLAGEMRKFTPTQPPTPAAAISFTDAMGNQHTLADRKGKVVLLNLWATWCAPCVAEMPSLDRLQAQFGGADFEVVALSLDKSGAAAVQPFFDKQGIRNLRAYLDPANAAVRALQVGALPTSILIDRAGREVGRLKGDAKWDGAEAKALLQYYVEGRSPG